jgi:SAM-dependent methyltransferase
LTEDENRRAGKPPVQRENLVSAPSSFDGYAENYNEILEKTLAVSGEGKDYYARGRVAWLARRLNEMGVRPRAVMDFGCGTGSTATWFHELLNAESVLGVEDSPKLVEVARRSFGGARTAFLSRKEVAPEEDMDLVFSSCVFHHIPVSERASAVQTIFRSLKPGGLFSLWEQNPWNPATKFLMSRCEFDKDAVTLTPPEARGLLRAGGFEIVRTDFLFIFPRAFAWLRWLEPMVSRLPLGAQYEVLGRKPAEPGRMAPEHRPKSL